MDISKRINITNPEEARRAISDIFCGLYPGHNTALLKGLFQNFSRLYRGKLPGFHACDTAYHDMQHVLDVTLAMARLIDGYERSVADDMKLGPDLASLGIAVALYHDSGYIRRKGDSRHSNGAEYTKIHVSRSARYIEEYLPTTELCWGVTLASTLVHFTGYELDTKQIDLPNRVHRNLGYLVGTADVIAQMADPDYLEKCRDHLFAEFQCGGLAAKNSRKMTKGYAYNSPVELLIKTPAFIKSTIAQRLDAEFGGMYKYASVYFGGSNLYMNALEKNCQHLESLLEKNDVSLLLGDQLKVPSAL